MLSAVFECFHTVFFMLPPLLGLDEMQLPLPCSEQVWAANGDQWQQARASNAVRCADEGQSICSVLTNIAAQPNTPLAVGESGRLAVLLASYVQCANARSLALAIRARQYSPYSALAESMKQCLDAAISLCQAQSVNASGNHLGSCGAFARLLAILSFAPQRLLFPFSRWQTTALGSQRARNELQELLNDHPTNARLCAYDAGQLLALSRAQSCLIHIDPFCVLIATIYLCAFNDLVAPNLPQPGIGNSADGTVIRIDQRLDNHELMEWVHYGSNKAPHITGVGTFGMERSTTRLLKESSRILGTNGKKSRLALALSRMLNSQAMGDVPGLEHEDV